jgi:hypothetical protein
MFSMCSSTAQHHPCTHLQLIELLHLGLLAEAAVGGQVTAELLAMQLCLVALLVGVDEVEAGAIVGGVWYRRQLAGGCRAQAGRVSTDQPLL